MKWFRLQDDPLPNWARTTIVLFIASALAVLPVWCGLSAILTGHLPRMENWDGDHWFGGRKLEGRPAVMAGCSLVCLGLAFFTLGLAQLRRAKGRTAMRALPWCFVALFGVLYLWTLTFK